MQSGNIHQSLVLSVEALCDCVCVRSSQKDWTTKIIFLIIGCNNKSWNLSDVRSLTIVPKFIISRWKLSHHKNFLLFLNLLRCRRLIFDNKTAATSRIKDYLNNNNVNLTAMVFFAIFRKIFRCNNSFLWGIFFASATWSISLYLYWMLSMSGKFFLFILFKIQCNPCKPKNLHCKQKINIFNKICCSSYCP